MKRPLKSMPYAQAYVIEEENGDMSLVSYTTLVAQINDGWLSVYGLYSKTTRKHIGAFMREIGCDYSTARQLVKDNMMMNIFTGEVVER